MRRAVGRGLWLLCLLCALSVWHTWPLPLLWRSHLLGGHFEDPWMNAWHIDWVRRCVTSVKNPFFAEMLHHPLGAELVWHTLAPAKSLLGAAFAPWLGNTASLNLVVFTSFLLTGFTSFALCLHFARGVPAARWQHWAGALAGASVFTFSRYHLCHALAHMNLSALEGLPLFVLAYWHVLAGGGRRWLACAALCTGYVALCDFYYVYYLALFALGWLCVPCWQRGESLRSLWGSQRLRAAGKVALWSAVAAAPAIVPLLLHLRPEPISYHHGDSEYPADLLSAFYPDHLSMYNAWIPETARRALNRMQHSILNDAEGGTFLGIAAPLLAVFAHRRRGRGQDEHTLVILALGFGVLSLGVFLNVGGNEPLPAGVVLMALALLGVWRLRGDGWRRDARRALWALFVLAPFLPLSAYGEPLWVRVPLPFLLFKHLVPLFGRGGMPVRFLLLTQLCLALLVARGLVHLLTRLSAQRAPLVAAALILAVNLETKSVPFALTRVPDLDAVLAPIRDDADPGAAVFTDHVIGQWEETVHHRHVSYARQSRLPVREAALIAHPLQRYLVDHRSMGRLPGESELAAMRSALRAGNFRYFVAHTAATEFSDTPQAIARQRHRLIEEDLGGVLLYADADRQIYRFW